MFQDQPERFPEYRIECVFGQAIVRGKENRTVDFIVPCGNDRY